MGTVVILGDVTATAYFVTFIRSYGENIPYVHWNVCVFVSVEATKVGQKNCERLIM